MSQGGQALFFAGAVVIAITMPWLVTMYRRRTLKIVRRASALASFLAGGGLVGFAVMLFQVSTPLALGISIVAGTLNWWVHRVNTRHLI